MIPKAIDALNQSLEQQEKKDESKQAVFDAIVANTIQKSIEAGRSVATVRVDRVEDRVVTKTLNKLKDLGYDAYVNKSGYRDAVTDLYFDVLNIDFKGRNEG